MTRGSIASIGVAVHVHLGEILPVFQGKTPIRSHKNQLRNQVPTWAAPSIGPVLGASRNASYVDFAHPARGEHARGAIAPLTQAKNSANVGVSPDPTTHVDGSGGPRDGKDAARNGCSARAELRGCRRRVASGARRRGDRPARHRIGGPRGSRGDVRARDLFGSRSAAASDRALPALRLVERFDVGRTLSALQRSSRGAR